MQMDTRIPLMGQSVNVLGALSGGMQLAGQHQDMRRQNALAQLFQTQGPAILAGDGNALAALAALDPQAAMGLQSDLLGMESTRLGMDAQRQSMEFGRQDQAFQMDEREREDALRRTRGIEAALAQGDMATFDRMWAEEGLPPVSSPEEALAVLAQLGSGLETYGALQPDTADPTSGMQNYDFLVRQGMDPDEALGIAFSGGGPTINIGGEGQAMGTIPQGYTAVPDPTNPSGFRLEAIPGGPAAMDQQAAQAEAAGAAAAGADAAENDVRQADAVLDSIGRARALVEGASVFNPATGFGAQTAAQIGGTNAANLAALADTIVANIAFDRLEQMRKESPTGGALGSITERELQLLGSVEASLALSQKPEQFLYNLDRLEETYARIMEKAAAYPNAAQYGFGAGGQAPSAAPAAQAPAAPADMEGDALVDFYLNGGTP